MRPRTALPAALLAATTLIGIAARPSAATSRSTPTRPTPSAANVDITAARERCVADIDLRLAKLAALSAGLSAASAVTTAHRSAQQASLGAATSGLTQLEAKVRADTDARTLRADCQLVVADFRVFALRAPQTAYVIAGDEQAAAVGRLQAVVAKLAATGKDVSAAQAALDDLQAKLADAAPKAQGLADRVIPFSPANYNADKTLLAGARTTALQVRADLAAARVDLKAIAAALKAAAT